MFAITESLNRMMEAVALYEDIAAVRKQFSFIPDEEFDRIIRLDPTFDENRDSVGKYGKWLLSLYNKDNPLQHNSKNLLELISNYDKLKNDRKFDIEKDINKFKNVDDMQTAVENVEEKELTDRQKTRERQKNKDYDLVWQDEDWAIFVPNTWEADVNLGKGTNWCTADSREEFGKKHYDNYLQQGGKYYVIMNKHDKSEKYQFHFESNQFMDANDQSINIQEFVSSNESMTEFFEHEGYDIWEYGDADWEEVARIIIEEYGGHITDDTAYAPIDHPGWLFEKDEDWGSLFELIDIVVHGAYTAEDMEDFLEWQNENIADAMLYVLSNNGKTLPSQYLNTETDCNDEGVDLLFRAFCQYMEDWGTNFYVANLLDDRHVSRDIIVDTDDLYFYDPFNDFSRELEDMFYGDELMRGHDASTVASFIVDEFAENGIYDEFDKYARDTIEQECGATKVMWWVFGNQDFSSFSFSWAGVARKVFSRKPMDIELAIQCLDGMEDFKLVDIPESAPQEEDKDDLPF